MEAYEAILTRRSIRKFVNRLVAPVVVTEILKAAMMAPSAGNQQAWHFVVITDPVILNKIPTIHPHASMAREAKVGILVCGDPNLEKHKDYWVQDCAAASENILLAAHAKGLGAVWTGVYPREDRVQAFRVLLGIPDRIIPMSFIPMGYPGETKESPDRYQELRVHKNKW